MGNGTKMLWAKCVCVGGGTVGLIFLIEKKETFMVRSEKQECVLVSEKLVWDLISSKKDQSSCGTD